MGRSLKNYVSIATQYALDVIDQKIPACELVQSACLRQLDDLEKPPKPFQFDVDQANRVCLILEQFPHVKGVWAKRKKTLSLEPWQCFIITTIFGWVDHFGVRRFKTVYIEVPRKNAKSTITAALGLYMLSCDNEEGAECYAAATTHAQSKIVFGIAQQMARKNHDFCDKRGIAVNAVNINQLSTASKFESLSSADTLDGLNVSFAAIDELHAHKSRRVFDVLETATGARGQSLIWAISTAGSNKAGVCFEQRTYVKKLLHNVMQDDSYFGIVYTIDAEDDWKSIDAAEKANPNWNVSVAPADIQRKLNKALELKSAQNAYKTKHLNVWVNADEAWMNSVAWDNCHDKKMSLEKFEGRECYVGIDLASKVDIACIMLLFPRTVRGKVHYYLFGHYYLPADTVEESSNDLYSGWVTEGHITATPGNVIDFDQMEVDLLAVKDRFQVNEVAYDPFQATQFALHMEKAGLPMTLYKATVNNYSEPMKELEALVIAKKLHHNGDPVLTWMISNVVCHTDVKDNIYPRKELPQNKIDGVIGAIQCLGVATIRESKPRPYRKRGLVQL